MIALLSSTGLCKSVSQKTDTSDLGVYISSVTTTTAPNKIVPPAMDSDPWVIDDVMTDDGDGNDNEESGVDNDNDVNDINNNDNWW
jgi:hypothetical protein